MADEVACRCWHISLSRTNPKCVSSALCLHTCWLYAEREKPGKCLQVKLAGDFLLLKCLFKRMNWVKWQGCTQPGSEYVNVRAGPFEEEKELRFQSSVRIPQFSLHQLSSLRNVLYFQPFDLQETWPLRLLCCWCSVCWLALLHRCHLLLLGYLVSISRRGQISLEGLFQWPSIRDGSTAWGGNSA